VFESISELSNFSEEKEEYARYEIEPMFYIHLIIRQIIKAPHMAFMNGQIESGLTSIIIGVDQLEKLCRANDFFKAEENEKSEYDKKVDEINESNKGERLIDQATKANMKFEYLLREIFKHRVKEVILYV